MPKDKAKRLKPGQIVCYSADARTREGYHDPQLGVVKRTTVNGGILVNVHAYRHRHRSFDVEEWLSYHHVIVSRKPNGLGYSEQIARLDSGGSW